MNGPTEGIRLGDIGNYEDLYDFGAIAPASLVGLNLALLGGRIGGLGGLSLNSYFDSFGLEAYVANAALLLILFQLARWGYSRFYNVGGSKSWSPFVFLSILIVVQVLHDILFYYGVLSQTPARKNEMIDGLKVYVKENGTRAILGHSVFLVIVGVLAMLLKESTVMAVSILTIVTLYVMPYILTTVGPKPAPPPPPPKKKEDDYGTSPTWK